MIAAVLLSAAVMSSFQNVHVTRIKDGDTFEVVFPGLPEVFATIAVRVTGIDSPEMSADRKCEKKDAQIAKETLDKLLLSRTVNLNFCFQEKYFRINCAVMSQDGIDIGNYQLENYLANPYSGLKKSPWKCFQKKSMPTSKI